MALIPDSANSQDSEAFNYADVNRPAGPIDFIDGLHGNSGSSVNSVNPVNFKNPDAEQGRVRFQKMNELKQKFRERNHRFRERSRDVGRDVRNRSRERFFSFADALEAYVDRKIGRFYVSRKEHDEVRRLYEYQLELARQRAIMAEMEKEAVIGSAHESRRVVEELSDDAKKLLELNNQLKELLKQSIDKKVLSDSAPGSEVVMRTMKKIRGGFEKKQRRRTKPRKIKRR